MRLAFMQAGTTKVRTDVEYASSKEENLFVIDDASGEDGRLIEDATILNMEAER